MALRVGVGQGRWGSSCKFDDDLRELRICESYHALVCISIAFESCLFPAYLLLWSSPSCYAEAQAPPGALRLPRLRRRACCATAG